MLLKGLSYEEICDHIYYKQNQKDLLEVNYVRCHPYNLRSHPLPSSLCLLSNFKMEYFMGISYISLLLDSELHEISKWV